MSLNSLRVDCAILTRNRKLEENLVREKHTTDKFDKVQRGKFEQFERSFAKEAHLLSQPGMILPILDSLLAKV